MSKNTTPPVTLGDKLKSGNNPTARYTIAISLSLILGGVFWVLFASPEIVVVSMVVCAGFLILKTPQIITIPHFLLAGDKQGFMKDLNLSDKTVVIDGSNIYHFGLKNGVGRNVLSALVKELRSEGYRIVCFFDANIYFTLLDNTEFQKGQLKFSPRILQQIFGLQEVEIYVVPSRIPADLFVIDTLSHLPISFAVTNDRFRDHEASYDFLAKDRTWRKGVTLKNGTLSLYQHSFKNPVVM